MSAAAPSDPAAKRMVIWMWRHPKQGFLNTAIVEDGEVRQTRLHPKDTEYSTVKLGTIPEADANALIEVATRLPLAKTDAEWDASWEEAEFVEIVLRGAPDRRSLRLRVDELSNHPEVQAFRKQVITIRQKAWNSFWAFESVAGRIALVFGFLALLLCYFIAKDALQTARLRHNHQRIEATVQERQGANGYDVKKLIRVRFTLPGSAPQLATIQQYLSAEHWADAKPGGKVEIVRDPTNGKVWLESDLQRVGQDSTSIWILPAAAALIGFVLWGLLRPYRVAGHADGQQYLTRDDRVVVDEKDAIVSNRTLLLARIIFRLST